MPVVATSNEIVIRLHFGRSLGACFRALCGGAQLLVSLRPLDIIEGDAPFEVREMVLAWAAQHEQELWAAWQRGQAGLKNTPQVSLRHSGVPSFL